MKYLIMTMMLVMSSVNAGDDIGSSIDEYIEDNPEVVISAANATGKAKYAAAIGPIVTPPPTTIAAVAIGLSFAQSHTSSTGSAFTENFQVLSSK
jgi:hypothetical protein